MKVYDSENKQVLNFVTIFLTPEEAKRLIASLSDLADNPKKHHHHIPDYNKAQELTFAIYTPNNINSFDPESRRVIQGEGR